MAKKSFDVISTWKARHNANVRTAKAVADEVEATMRDMVARDITIKQLADEFIKDAGKAWGKNEEDKGQAKKGQPWGLNKARSENVPQAFWWDACRKQLSKWSFKRDGKPLMRGGKFVEAPTTGYEPKGELLKELKALGLTLTQMKKNFSNVAEASLFAQKKRMEVALQVEVNQMRTQGGFSEPVKAALKRMVEVAGLNVNIPDVLKAKKQTVVASKPRTRGGK